MRLQVSSQIAIFALLELAAQPTRQVAVAEIGGKFGVSNHHLAKVMNILTRAGMVRSLRGAKGGYQFSGNARRITLLDVIELFEQLGQPAANFRSPKPTDEERALRGVLGEIDDLARSTLGSITLATMSKLVAGSNPARNGGPVPSGIKGR
jgi:Rrf2 family protein